MAFRLPRLQPERVAQSGLATPVVCASQIRIGRADVATARISAEGLL